jgi:hypothetical protein
MNVTKNLMKIIRIVVAFAITALTENMISVQLTYA